jgi:hypothetical protein
LATALGVLEAFSLGCDRSPVAENDTLRVDVTYEEAAAYDKGVAKRERLTDAERPAFDKATRIQIDWLDTTSPRLE